MDAEAVTCHQREGGREVAVPGPGRRQSVGRSRCGDDQGAVIHSSVTCCQGDKCNPGIFFFFPFLAGFWLEPLLTFGLEEVVKQHAKCQEMEI